MEIMLHPRVKRYLDESGEKERLIEHVKAIAEDPYNKRSGADIKRLKGKKYEMYRLRVGEHRFEFFIDDETVWIDNVFRRGRGYR